MIDPRLRLRHLRCFLETARLGSLSAAADALNVSQPAASKSLKELEQILEATLFDRSGRRLTLTQSGKLFQRHAGSALGELSQAADLLRGAPKQSTKIAIGALPTTSTDLLPRAALAFHAQQPNCLLRVSTGPNWLLLSQLREGSLDMVVGRSATTDGMEGLSFRQLYSEEVGAILRPDHPLLNSKNPISDLRNYPLILPPKGAVISPMVRAFLMRHGHGDVSPAFESVSLAFGRAVVQKSDAVWFISKGVVQQELTSGTLTAMSLGDTLLGGPVGVSMRDGVSIPAEQQILLDTLIALVA